MTPAKGSTDMEKLISQLRGLVWFASIGVAAVVWFFATFATVKYVDAKHDSVLSELREIKHTVRTADQRLYELNGRKGPAPATIRVVEQ